MASTFPSSGLQLEPLAIAFASTSEGPTRKIAKNCSEQSTQKTGWDMSFTRRFYRSSTASQVLEGVDLTGKTILITGSTNGIGFETAKALAVAGATVILSGRSEKSCREAEAKILQVRPDAKLFYAPMELTSLTSVKQGAASIKHHCQDKKLDVVILNAGVIGMGWQMTEDKLESVFQINHLSQFYLTMLLEDTLQSGSRVVIVASDFHRFTTITSGNLSLSKLSPPTKRGFWDTDAYNNSKLCNILFCTELHRRWSPRGIQVVSLHPGNLVSTGLPKRSFLYKFAFALVYPFTKSLEQSAATSVFCAVAPEVRMCGGQFFRNCYTSEPIERATNAEMAKKLWDISEELVSRFTSI